ncbi:hypothetical protein J437_LFUL009691 [Ladona fulva]|uniref:Uncharacterized protein n=1 Tax=Ladona fulva TaxID=123851 RepID=A0A8K0K6B5_LADFU|nr:hypothetical protein J437_LFUL009691 [Ladona fulva]
MRLLLVKERLGLEEGALVFLPLGQFLNIASLLHQPIHDSALCKISFNPLPHLPRFISVATLCFHKPWYSLPRSVLLVPIAQPNPQPL